MKKVHKDKKKKEKQFSRWNIKLKKRKELEYRRDEKVSARGLRE